MTHRSDAWTVHPIWPERGDLRQDQLRFVYDRLADTLYVDFDGHARPAVSVPLDQGDRDYLYLRVDPETHRVVGLHIEAFLAYAVAQHPEFIEALEIAELRGFDDLEAAELQRRAREQARERADAVALIAAVERLSA